MWQKEGSGLFNGFSCFWVSSHQKNNKQLCKLELEMYGVCFTIRRKKKTSQQSVFIIISLNNVMKMLLLYIWYTATDTETYPETHTNTQIHTSFTVYTVKIQLYILYIPTAVVIHLINHCPEIIIIVCIIGLFFSKWSFSNKLMFLVAEGSGLFTLCS